MHPADTKVKLDAQKNHADATVRASLVIMDCRSHLAASMAVSVLCACHTTSLESTLFLSFYKAKVVCFTSYLYCRSPRTSYTAKVRKLR